MRSTVKYSKVCHRQGYETNVMTRLNTRFTYGKYNIMLSFELIFIAEVLNIKGTSTEMNECYIYGNVYYGISRAIE